MLPPGHHDVVEAENFLAQLDADGEGFDAAVGHVRRSLRTLQTTLPPDHPDVRWPSTTSASSSTGTATARRPRRCCAGPGDSARRPQPDAPRPGRQPREPGHGATPPRLRRRRALLPGVLSIYDKAPPPDDSITAGLHEKRGAVLHGLSENPEAAAELTAAVDARSAGPHLPARPSWPGPVRTGLGPAGPLARSRRRRNCTAKRFDYDDAASAAGGLKPDQQGDAISTETTSPVCCSSSLAISRTRSPPTGPRWPRGPSRRPCATPAHAYEIADNLRRVLRVTTTPPPEPWPNNTGFPVPRDASNGPGRAAGEVKSSPFPATHPALLWDRLFGTLRRGRGTAPGCARWRTSSEHERRDWRWWDNPRSMPARFAVRGRSAPLTSSRPPARSGG